MDKAELFVLSLSFLDPAILLGLPAVIIPIVIHLWNRRKHVEMNWAAMEFVLAALAIERRRILLREYLLLLLRMVAIALLIVAAARPIVESPAVAMGYRAATGWIFVVDDSLSMCQSSQGKSCFDRAKAVITSIVKNAGPADAFCLLKAAQPPTWEVELAISDRQSFLQIVDQIKCRHTRNDWLACLETVLVRTQRLREEYPQLTRCVVVIITDGQREPWDQAIGRQGSALSSTADELVRQAELVICRVAGDQGSNAAITRLEASPLVCSRNEEAVIAGQVTIFGSIKQRPATVEWFIDGVKIGESRVEWNYPDNGMFIWSYRASRPGDHVIEAVIPDDQLAIDNRRGVVVSIRNQVRVLCIDGRYSPIPFQGASDYVRLALTPESSAQETGPIEVHVIPESRLLESDITHFDMVVLCDVAQITPGEIELLADFLRLGGGLVIFAGPRVQTAAYNRTGEFEHTKEPFLPGRLEEIVNKPNITTGPIDARHAITRIFAGWEGSGLTRIPVRNYLRFQPTNSIPCQIVARYSSEDPFIIAWEYGMGRGVLITTSADTSWTSLPLWPIWVPLIQEIKAWTLSGGLSGRTLVCGQPLSLSMAMRSAREAPRIRLTDSQGKTWREPAELVDGTWQWKYTQTDWSGVYKAEIDSGSQESRGVALFSVNSPLEESDLRWEGWEEALKDGLRGAHTISAELVSQILESPSQAGGTSGNTLSRLLLLCLLALILVEIVIAHIGKQ